MRTKTLPSTRLELSLTVTTLGREESLCVVKDTP